MKKFLIGAALLVAIVVIALFIRRAQVSSQFQDLMQGAMSIVPLPPGVSEFQIDGDDSERSFMVSAELSGVSEKEILDFYRSHYDAAGWTNEFADDEGIDGMLNFVKDRASINVTTIQLGSQIHLLVIYTKFDHTREEFTTLVSESASADALQLVATIRNTYATLISYRDTGTLNEHYDDGEMSSSATFSTSYRAPDHLRFSYAESPRDFDPGSYELAMQGATVQSMADFDDEPEVGDDVSLAIAGLYGVTGTTSGNIPELLFQIEDTVFDLIHLSVIADTSLSDGTLCARLQGTDFMGQEVTVWAGNADFLIRKIESKQDSRNWSAITYTPETNVEIPDEVFEFTRPVAP